MRILFNEIEGCIAAISIPDAFYILRKQYSIQERRNMLIELFDIVTVVGIDSSLLLSSLRNMDFTDFEDCIQEECAKAFNVDYICTRDSTGFILSTTPLIDPSDLIKLFGAFKGAH